MPTICPLRPDCVTYLQEHGLVKKWMKAKKMFELNPRYPSLHTELLEPRQYLIYSFRLDRKYRVLFYFHQDESVEVINITAHYQ